LWLPSQPGLLAALVRILDPNATDADSTFADEHDLVVRFALSAISQLALDKHSRIALAKEKDAIKFIFARARNESKEAYIRMTAMIALSNLLLERSVCSILLADKTTADELVYIATTVPVVEDIKRKCSAALSLDCALNALYNLCASTAWLASKFAFKPAAHQRLLAIASGNPQFQSVYLADRVASCLDPLRALGHPDVSSSPFVFDSVLPGTFALGEVAGGVGDFFSTVFAKTKSGLSSVGDATGISKAVDAAATGLDKAKSCVVDAVVAPMQQPEAGPAADSTSALANPFLRAFDAVKSGVTAIGDLGLVFLGRQDCCEAILEACRVMPEVCRDHATMTVRFSFLSNRISFPLYVRTSFNPSSFHQVRTCAYAGTGNVVHIQELMHVCAEHRDATSEKKRSEFPLLALLPAAPPPLPTQQLHLLLQPPHLPADIYPAGAGPAADSATSTIAIKQAVAAIGLVAAVLGEEVGGEMARCLLDGMLQVFNPRPFSLSGLQCPRVYLCCVACMQ
jgi:hypothetical protein